MIFVISEKAEKKLINSLLKEEIGGWSDKVNIVKKYLDDNFLKANNSIIGDNGRPTMHDILIWVDKYKNPKQYLSDKDAFYILQDEFKNIFGPDEDGSHRTRDNFLKQCLKDWYYNKISKNGSLTMYEGNGTLGRAASFDRNNGVGNSGSLGFKNWTYENAANSAAMQMSQEPQILQHWDDITLEGIQIINDINYLLNAFNNKRKSARKNVCIIICDQPKCVSETSKDYFNTLRTLYSTRAAFKWCFMCPNLAKGLDLQTLNFIKHQYLKTNIDSKRDFSKESYNLFPSTAERDRCLPFFGDFSQKLKTFNTSALKQEINSAAQMTLELNAKIEHFLDEIGFQPTKLKPEMLGNSNANLDISDIDFDNY